MAQTGFTPVQLYHSTTAAATPSAGNLAAGELAVNITDGKLFYKDNGGVVRVLATAAGSAGDVVGPGSSTDNALVRFDGTTGKLVQSSVGVLSDAGALSGLTSVAATTFTGALTGNASTATTLQTSRTIWGQSFDGSANVTGALTGVTDLTASGSLTLNGGTANGVPYLNGSKVLTTGSALTFDGTNIATTGGLSLGSANNLTWGGVYGANIPTIAGASNTLQFYPAGSTSGEQMRLTSTGLGIGTSSVPSYAGYKTLAINGTSGGEIDFLDGGTTRGQIYSASTSLTVTTIGAIPLLLGTNGTTKATIDSSGNLGLGVTPSAWNSGYKALQVGNTSISNQVNVNARFSQNAAVLSTGTRYITSDFATEYLQGSGAHAWFTAPSGTAGNAISFTQAMTLDASGYLLVGATSSLGAGQSRFQLGSASSATSGSLLKSTNSALGFYASSTSSSYMTWASGTFMAFGEAPDNLGSFTERARIDSSGNLLVGTTSFVGGAGNARLTSVRNDSGWFAAAFQGYYGVGINALPATGALMYFYYNGGGGPVGSISTNGTTTAYSTSSDYRLKENIQPMTGALAKVAQLKPVTYTWKADGSTGEGFIAHELAEVCPAAVTGEKDAVDKDGKPQYQGIDVSFLVGTLTAAIQELKAEFDAYKASHP